MIAWKLFCNPIMLRSDSVLWLLPPLCLSVAIVYKAVRLPHLNRLVIEVLALIAYMIAGLIVLGVGLWFLQTYWP